MMVDVNMLTYKNMECCIHCVKRYDLGQRMMKKKGRKKKVGERGGREL
jgi:hypothetical protein